jgi:hypothetical protein
MTKSRIASARNLISNPLSMGVGGQRAPSPGPRAASETGKGCEPAWQWCAWVNSPWRGSSSTLTRAAVPVRGPYPAFLPRWMEAAAGLLNT